MSAFADMPVTDNLQTTIKAAGVCAADLWNTVYQIIANQVEEVFWGLTYAFLYVLLLWVSWSMGDIGWWTSAYQSVQFEDDEGIGIIPRHVKRISRFLRLVVERIFWLALEFLMLIYPNNGLQMACDSACVAGAGLLRAIFWSCKMLIAGTYAARRGLVNVGTQLKANVQRLTEQILNLLRSNRQCHAILLRCQAFVAWISNHRLALFICLTVLVLLAGFRRGPNSHVQPIDLGSWKPAGEDNKWGLKWEEDRPTVRMPDEYLEELRAETIPTMNTVNNGRETFRSSLDIDAIDGTVSWPPKSLERTKVGKKNVWCMACRQWHCCEVPY